MPGALPIALLVAVAAAPGSAGGTARPRAADAIVLRLAIEAGGEEGGEGEAPVPEFTLYGDGTAIHGGAALRRARLGHGQVEELLRLALDDCGLGQAEEATGGEERREDGRRATLLVSAGGVRRTVELPAAPAAPATRDTSSLRRALGCDPALPPDERLARLGSLLADFASLVAAGRVRDAGIYHPRLYEASLELCDDDQDLKEWIWPQVDPEEFARHGEFRTRLLAPAEARFPGDPGEEDEFLGPDCACYAVSVRPLLPDEIAAGLTRYAAARSKRARRKAEARATARPAPPSLEALLDDIRQGGEEEMQALVEGIDRLGAEAVPGLIGALGDVDEDVRVGVVWSLRRLGSAAAAAAPRLIEALGDEERIVRAGAARALARLGPAGRAALPALEAGDEEECVATAFRRAAAELAGR